MAKCIQGPLCSLLCGFVPVRPIGLRFVSLFGYLGADQHVSLVFEIGAYLSPFRALSFSILLAYLLLHFIESTVDVNAFR